MTAFVDGFIGTDGSIDSRIEGINSQLTDIGDQRIELDRRASVLEERFVSQFAALDQVVAELNTIGTFLAQNLASLPGFSNQQS